MTIRTLVVSLAAAVFGLQGADVALVGASGLDGPAQHGLGKLIAVLQARGHRLVAAAEASHVLVLGCEGRSVEGPESLSIWRVRHAGKPAISLCGGGPRGLMYAMLDVAERVGWSAGDDPFARVRDTSERAYLEERGISMYTMQRAYFESRLFDENYWKRYFDLLAASRINTFTVIFGYENGGFMAPLYPYFFDVPGFAGVRLVGITKEQQAKHTAAFHTLIRIAHERGIDVIPAVWDHIYRGGVQGGGIAGASATVGKDVPGLVSGVTGENLTAYTKAALQEFVRTFPDIDGIEFRMHSESGLKPDEMAGFWHDVFGMLAKAKPRLRVTLRAKELPDAIIDDALRQGLRARVETKYWMEQMGLPYHPTHVNRQNQHERRHGYADLLKYPQRYRVHWRLWSGGTARLLLWADPEYVRRFAESARLYDGNSFDVNEMLATKMLGEPHDKAPLAIHTQGYRFYEYEFERYWHFYQVWGRVSYNPRVPAEIWEEEFQRRFGEAGVRLMRAVHAASRVLPRIVAASYRYQLFPTTRGWAEMMRQGDLAEFATAEGTDIEQFQSPRDAARARDSGARTSKRTPEQSAKYLAGLASTVRDEVERAERIAGLSKEAITTITDLKILAGLADFHAARLRGAVAYNCYRNGSQRNDLLQAIHYEGEAVAAWKRMVAAAGDVYSPELAFGVHRVGFPRHWREELERLELGLRKLRDEDKAPVRGEPVFRPERILVRSDAAEVQLVRPERARAGQDLKVSVIVKSNERTAPLDSIRLRYRHLTQFEDYATVDFVEDGKGVYSATIPGAFIVPQWDLMYFVEVIDRVGQHGNYPDLDREAPYVIVPVDRERRKP